MKQTKTCSSITVMVLRKLFLMIGLFGLSPAWADQTCLAYQFSCFEELNQIEVRLLPAYDCAAINQTQHEKLREKHHIQVQTYDNPKNFLHGCELNGKKFSVSTIFSGLFHCKYGDDFVSVTVDQDENVIIDNLKLSDAACEPKDTVKKFTILSSRAEPFVITEGVQHDRKAYIRTFFTEDFPVRMETSK